MSLIHWWPLNGSLNDYGVLDSSITITNQPSTQYIPGKIGQCYNFNGGPWMQVSGVSVGKDCSICVWARSTTNGTMLWGMQCAGSDYMNLYNSGSMCLNVGDSDDNPFRDSNGNNVPYFNDNVWHHFVVVFKGDERAKLYIDGVYRGQAVTYRNPTMNNQNFTIGTWNYSSHGYYWNGGICDVRIYSHALSQKEVKEISKGLVLHYNFEDAYAEGTTNLINQNGAITNTVRCSTYKNGVKIDWTNPDNQGDTYFMFNTPNMTEGVTYTLSFDCEGLLSDSDTTWAVSNTYSPAKLHNGRNAFTFTANSSALQLFFDDWSRDTRLNNLTMTNFQLEQKDHATPYVNGTRPNGLIYDNSGYGYNGTIVGNCQIIPESKSGDHSLFNNGSGLDNWNETGKAFVLGDLKSAMTFESMTISFWAKIMATYGNHSGVISLSTSDYWPTDYTTGGLAQYDGVFRFNTSDGSPSVSQNIIFNEWHHYALTWDGSTLSMYRDGVWVAGTSSSGSINQSRYVYLGLNGAGGMWRKSQIDWGDFKIYSTALSAEDILLEYNRKASIDKNGNLFVPYIKEYEATKNIGELANYYIETQHAFDGRFGPLKESDYNAYYPNGQPGIGTYEQGNLIVTMTNQGIRIYSEPNRDGRAIEGSEWNTWGGFCWSPMKQSRCLVKGHHYRLSWHVKGQSSRAMTDVYWSNQIGWGQYPDASPTVHKAVTHPANFQGEMDCFYDFTIEDDIFKTTTDDVHAGFEPNTSYLAYSAFKIGYTYDFTGPLGTDIYITNLQLHDLTTGDVYKIGKNGVVKTIEVVSGRRDSARLHSDGVIDVTDIIEN